MRPLGWFLALAVAALVLVGANVGGTAGACLGLVLGLTGAARVSGGFNV